MTNDETLALVPLETRVRWVNGAIGLTGIILSSQGNPVAKPGGTILSIRTAHGVYCEYAQNLVVEDSNHDHDYLATDRVCGKGKGGLQGSGYPIRECVTCGAETIQPRQGHIVICS